jgi:hypothetical protein
VFSHAINNNTICLFGCILLEMPECWSGIASRCCLRRRNLRIFSGRALTNGWNLHRIVLRNVEKDGNELAANTIQAHNSNHPLPERFYRSLRDEPAVRCFLSLLRTTIGGYKRILALCASARLVLEGAIIWPSSEKTRSSGSAAFGWTTRSFTATCARRRLDRT